jgi:isopentenyl-diphosphate delta-isomerase type 1
MHTTDNQQELFIVVDKNDNILEYRTRYECHHDKSLIHRTVGVLIYNRHGELLLQKRSLTKDLDPGLWGVSVGGHVTKGQTDEEAAMREMKEELGISTRIHPLKKWIMYSKWETERGMLYTAIYDGPFNPDPVEVDHVEFFAVSRLPKDLSQAAELTLREAGII